MQKSKITEVAKALRKIHARRVLITDIDGTVYQWQLLIDLVLVIAKHNPDKRPIVQPLREAINGYKKRVTPFSIVIKILISIIPEVIKGVNKNLISKYASARARSVESMVYIFPRTLIQIVTKIKDDPWLVIAITGAPQEVADPFCGQLGIHVVIGSHYESDSMGIYTGIRDIDSGINKGAIVHAISKECPEIDWNESIALGDSENDLAMFKRCGYSLAINPNTPLLKYARDASHTIAIVRDGQKSGVQIFLPNTKGILTEVCPGCVLPKDIAKIFPAIPGILDPKNCTCSA